MVLGIHVSFGEVERTVLSVSEGFSCEFLAARARHNLELCGGFGVRVPAPNKRADRDNPNQRILAVLGELTHRAGQGAGQTYRAGGLQQHDRIRRPAFARVEVDGVLDYRFGGCGIFGKMRGTHKRNLGAVVAGDGGEFLVFG